MTTTPVAHIGRRRCCECRAWYSPAPSAANTQKTCSPTCRRRRRARQERVRRRADLANARADERERQRKHRARGAPEERPDPPMSRAGLGSQVPEIVSEILADVGEAQRRSLTGLRRRVRRNLMRTLGKIDGGLGNLGQDRPPSLTGLHP